MLHYKARFAGFVFSPPWTAGMPEMQEHYSAVPGSHECRKRRSFFFGAWMARIPKSKEHLCVHAEPELF